MSFQEYVNIPFGPIYSRDGAIRSFSLTTLDRTLSGQTRWMWIRLDMNQVMIGLGYVYDVTSILATLYDATLKPVDSVAVWALPAACQFVIPYQLYNGNSVSFITH